MFDYRYHALSLAAVLFALALGVLLGVAIGDSNLVSSAKSGIVHNLNSEVSQARHQAGAAAGAAHRRGSVRERPVSARRARTAGRTQRSGWCSSAAPPTRSTRSCAPPSRRPAATSRRSSPCASRSNLTGIASEAAGTHYAALAGSPQLVERFGELVGRQLVSGGQLVDRELLSRVRGEPAERLRRSARHAWKGSSSCAPSPTGHDRRTERSRAPRSSPGLLDGVAAVGRARRRASS